MGVEIAKKLEQKGHKGQIIAIDGSPEYLLKGLQQGLVLDSPEELQISLLCAILSMFLPFDLILQKRPELALCHGFQKKVEFARNLIPPDTPNRDQLNEQSAIVIYKRIKTCLNYKFEEPKLKSNIFLFKTTQPMVVGCDDDYKLSEMFEKPVKVAVIDADHVTILESEQLVQEVQKLLKQEVV